ncbi:MAG: nitrous oxide reductase family maturation protein NosD [Oligoflexia bacterium]|nr:nitrous oxide reductase family maturation protein NosD [Oligoflexia bacterium]
MKWKLALSMALALTPLRVFALTVCHSGCDFDSIPKALEQSASGEVLTVLPGIYSEHETILLKKPVTLAGQPGAVIEGQGGDSIVTIKVRGVKVLGFEIRNSGSSYLHELAGIRVEGVEDCEIAGNRLINNAYGIYLAESSGCRVTANTIVGMPSQSEAESGNGIHSWKGSRHFISNNQVRGHRDGVYLEFTDDSEIADNMVLDNERYGLHFMSSNRNEYRSNRFEHNGAGVAVMYSRDIRMLRNVFRLNSGVASYGLLLKDITTGIISGNIFDDNTTGIYMEDTNRSKFNQNYFLRNGYGLRILGNCENNLVENNNFIGNTFDVATNSSRNPNRFAQNYWSQYAGYDVNRDGIGDVPYRPVSLSSVIVEKLDSSYVLIKSPLLQLLDRIEQGFPMLIPESLKDEAPLDRPFSTGQELEPQ